MLRFYFFAAKQGTSVHKYDRGPFTHLKNKQNNTCAKLNTTFIKIELNLMENQLLDYNCLNKIKVEFDGIQTSKL